MGRHAPAKGAQRAAIRTFSRTGCARASLFRLKQTRDVDA